MGSMMTSTSTAAKQPIPEQEPPVGTIASFHFRLASGAGSATDFMQRTPDGWSATPFAQSHELRSWADLTDLDARNAAIQKRNPGSTAVFTSVEIAIHYAPPAADGALGELEQAIILAAGRAGLKTDHVTPTELVNALANLVLIGGRR